MIKSTGRPRLKPGRSDPERDVFAALERWVEKGVAPEKFVGAGTASAIRTSR